MRVNLWDLAGPAEYLEVRNEFHKDTQAAILVYDVTSRPSFEALGSWLEESQKYGAPANMVRRLIAKQQSQQPSTQNYQRSGRSHKQPDTFVCSSYQPLWRRPQGVATVVTAAWALQQQLPAIVVLV